MSRIGTRLARAAAAVGSRPLAIGGDLVVLAPHPDDETLGCGGTIRKSVDSGARVTIVFLTDGSDSHRDRTETGELRTLRRIEGLAAAGVLGVEPPDVRFLDHPDGNLSAVEASAGEQARALVSELAPSAVLAPCRWDVSPDHLAAARIAAFAAGEAAIPVHGYATWFWDRWPWTSTTAGSPPRTAARAAVGYARLLRHFRTTVEIGDVLEIKRRALAEHRTQVERRAGDPSWPVLGDVADGAFVDRLLAPREVFATVLP